MRIIPVESGLLSVAYYPPDFCQHVVVITFYYSDGYESWGAGRGRGSGAGVRGQGVEGKAAEAVGMLPATAEHAPSAHFYPALWRALLQGSTHVRPEEQLTFTASMLCERSSGYVSLATSKYLLEEGGGQ